MTKNELYVRREFGVEKVYEKLTAGLEHLTAEEAVDTLLGGASSSWQSLDYTSVYATPFSSSSRVVRITPLSNADISDSDTVAITLGNNHLSSLLITHFYK